MLATVLVFHDRQQLKNSREGFFLILYFLSIVKCRDLAETISLGLSFVLGVNHTSLFSTIVSSLIWKWGVLLLEGIDS